jgi:hypothetical protein
MATLPTDVAASFHRPELSRAVDHAPDALLYKSTVLEILGSAVNLIRRQPAAAQTPESTKQHTQQLQHNAKLQLP